jgi:hypothetical protein
MVYAHKVNTREELLPRILSAARIMYNVAVPIVRLQVLWSHESEYSSKQTEYTSKIFWVLNGESVSVVLTPLLNKSTMLHFTF